MNKRLLLVVIVGCGSTNTTSTTPRESQPIGAAPVGGQAYGGVAYGGAAYGGAPYGGSLYGDVPVNRDGFGPGDPDPNSKIPSVQIGQPNANGDLDKAIIRRYIKRNINKVRYCYEKELASNAKLAGTVNADFTIAPDGTVSASTATGVSATVSSCVAGVMKSIEFPKPKGGGSVHVNYPFVFRPSGG